MEKIGFIGTFDKTDFLIYVSRILVEMGKKVLIIDSTVKLNTLFQLSARRCHM